MTSDQRYLHDIVRFAEPVPENGPTGDWYRLPPLGSVGQMLKIGRFGGRYEVVGYATYNA